MSHHLQGLNNEFIQKVDNIFLIRDPKEVIPSLTIQLPNAKVRDTGLDIQWRLYQSLISYGKNPVIVDSRELLIDPEFIAKRDAYIERGQQLLKENPQWRTDANSQNTIYIPVIFHVLYSSASGNVSAAQIGANFDQINLDFQNKNPDGDEAGINPITGQQTTEIPDINTKLRGYACLLYTSPSPRDRTRSRMPSSA